MWTLRVFKNPAAFNAAGDSQSLSIFRDSAAGNINALRAQKPYDFM